MPLVPVGVPARDAIVFGSGVAELVCAGGLLTRAPWAGVASALLLILVFPGNVVYAVEVTNSPAASPVEVAVAWGRLPLQLPLIWVALQARVHEVP